MLCQQKTRSPDGQMCPTANWDNGINLIDLLRGVIRRSLISGWYCEYFANTRYTSHSFTHPFVQQALLLHSVCVRSDSTGIKVRNDKKETENPSLSHSLGKVDCLQAFRHYWREYQDSVLCRRPRSSGLIFFLASPWCMRLLPPVCSYCGG